MNRVAPFLVLLLSATALAQDAVLPDAAPVESPDAPVESAQAPALETAENTAGRALFESLAPLLSVDIPGETQQVPGIAFDELEAFFGQPVVRIFTPSPPPGFEPSNDAGILLGTVLTRQTARRMALNIWETGRYREIHIRAQKEGIGVALALHVEPMFRMVRTQLSGNSALDDARVKRAINFIPGATVVPSDETMVALRERLEEEYDRRGYPDARAAIRLETAEVPGEVVLRVEVDEGAPDRFTVVSLKGLPDDLSEEEMLRRADLKKGIVKDDLLVKEAIEKLAAVLYERDYPDAVVLENYSFARTGSHSLRLIITVVPGIRTKVRVEGNRRLRERALRAHVLSSGAFRSSPEGVLAAVAKLQDFAVRRGLFHATVTAERHCHANALRYYPADPRYRCRPGAAWQEIVFFLREGPPVEVEEIYINGNEFFSERELREEVFAFMAERNAPQDTFEPFSAGLLDSAVSRRAGTRRTSGNRTVFERPDRVYVREHYLEATGHLQDIYKEDGFLSVAVDDTCLPQQMAPRQYRNETYLPLKMPAVDDGADGGVPCVWMDGERRGILVEFFVRENTRTLIRKLEVRGNNPDVFTASALLDIGSLAIGDAYNEYRIRVAAGDIDDAYKDAGYMFSSVAWSSSVSKDGKAADVTLTVEEGPKVHVNAILINAEDTNRWFIADNLGFHSGDVVTPKLLAEARRRVLAIGTFNSVTVQMQSPTTVSERKNIVVTVIERKPQYLELRAGVATEEGIRGGFEWGHRNMGGLAIASQLRMRANFRHPDVWFFGPDAQEFKEDLEQRWANHQDDMIARSFLWFEWYVLLGIKTTNVPGTGGLLGTGFDITFENVNRRGYSAMSIKPYYRLTSNYLRFLPIELKTGVEGTIVIPSQDPDVNDDILGRYRYSRLPSGKALFFVTSLSVSADFRDNPLDPRKGVFANIRGDYVQFLRTERQAEDVDRQSRYIKAMVSLSGYIPFARKANVIALSASAGYMFHLTPESTAWADRYFYMGGVSTLRGFASDAVVPQDIYYAGLDNPDIEVENELGGEAMFLLRSEVRHDFGKNVIGAVFAEAGNLWRDTKNFLRNKERDPAPWLLRPVGGLGIRYNTPVGPISFDVGLNLDKRKYESRWAWYFSIGSAF